MEGGECWSSHRASMVIAKFKFESKIDNKQHMSAAISMANVKVQPQLAGCVVKKLFRICVNNSPSFVKTITALGTYMDMHKSWPVFVVAVLSVAAANDVIGRLEQRFHRFAKAALTDAPKKEKKHVNGELSQELRKYSETLKISDVKKVIKGITDELPEVYAMWGVQICGQYFFAHGYSSN